MEAVKAEPAFLMAAARDCTGYYDRSGWRSAGNPADGLVRLGYGAGARAVCTFWCIPIPHISWNVTSRSYTPYHVPSHHRTTPYLIDTNTRRGRGLLRQVRAQPHLITGPRCCCCCCGLRPVFGELVAGK